MSTSRRLIQLLNLVLVTSVIAGCASWRRPYRGHAPPPAVRQMDARDSALFATDAPPSDTLRLDRTTEAACHNFYDPDLLRDFTLAPASSGSVEIDVFDRWGFGMGGRDGGWYVRHAGWGNYSNCVANRGSGDLFACLRVVRAWLADSTAPGMIVFLDKKQPWSRGRSPRALDSLIASVVPRGRIFSPRKLRGGFASPRTAAATSGWPCVRELRGRGLFGLTGPQRPPA
jgi:hypothetical protein